MLASTASEPLCRIVTDGLAIERFAAVSRRSAVEFFGEVAPALDVAVIGADVCVGAIGGTYSAASSAAQPGAE